MGDGLNRIRVRTGEIELEGSSEFIQTHFTKLWNELKQMRSQEKDAETTKRESITKSGKINEGMSLAEFYKSKNPETHPDRMLVFYYWLKHREQKGEASLKDIKECYSLISIPPDPNSSQTALTISSGSRALLMRGTVRGQYKLTMTGEQYVEKELQKEE